MSSHKGVEGALLLLKLGDELAGEKPERCDVIGGMGEDGKVAVEITDLLVTLLEG